MLNSFGKIHKNEDELYALDMEIAEKDGVKHDLCFPKFHKGSNYGVILVHGFCACPKEMHTLYNRLCNLGFSVYNVRVAGHGSYVEDMDRVTYLDWYNSIEIGYNCLSNFCDKIIIVGQSVGGLLSTAVSALNKVSGMVLLAPAFQVNNSFFKFLPYVYKFYKRIPRAFRKEEDKKYNYEYFPTVSCVEILKLQKEVSKIFDKIDVPTLMAVSHNDHVIKSKDVIKAFDHLKSQNKELLLYDNHDFHIRHILTEEHMESTILVDITNWIEKTFNN